MKFRVWDKTNEEFLDDDGYYLSQSGELIAAYCNGSLSLDLDFYEVKQYTGMPDVDGSEIYEGAILRCADNHLWVVSLVDGCFIAHAPNCISEFVYLYDYDFTVVGDVHETPELLKEKRR